MDVRPSRARFKALAKHATVVPVTTESVADDLTPVLAYDRLGGGDGSFLLESVVGGDRWARYSFVGARPQARIVGYADGVEVSDSAGVHELPGGFRSLETLLTQWTPPDVAELELPRFWGGAVGFLAYEIVSEFEPSVRFPGEDRSPHFAFALGNDVVVFDALRQSTRLVVSQRTEGDLDAAYDAALQRLRTLHRRLRTPGAPLPTLPLRPRATMTLPPSSFSKDDFLRAVERCKEHIRSGDIFQAVLSQRFEVRAEVNPFTAYRALRVVNPSPYMFHLRLGERSVSGASPETLVRVEDGVATLRPIAGTRPRGSTRAEDAAHEASLLADPKERAEHVMLIDLGRNDLGRISTAGGVSITEAMVVERYSHVMHMTSNLEGRVREGLNAFDVIASTFPAGTLSGAPKVRAMQILAELEPVSRGLYGGAVGYIGFDGSTDLAIAIRTAEFRQGRASLQAGAGIVEASVPEREWEETVHKARAGLTALSMAAEATEPA